MKNIWAYKSGNMYAIRDTLNYERTKFTDVDALMVFTDNHDNKRFLNIKNDHKAFQASLIFSLFA
jgi:alpha-amylase